jgi:hypothetical protein
LRRGIFAGCCDPGAWLAALLLLPVAAAAQIILPEEEVILGAAVRTRCFRHLLLVNSLYDLLAKQLIADLASSRNSDPKSGLIFLKSKGLYQSCQQLMAEAPFWPQLLIRQAQVSPACMAGVLTSDPNFSAL